MSDFEEPVFLGYWKGDPLIITDEKARQLVRNILESYEALTKSYEDLQHMYDLLRMGAK